MGTKVPIGFHKSLDRLTQYFDFFEDWVHRDLLFDERDPT